MVTSQRVKTINSFDVLFKEKIKNNEKMTLKQQAILETCIELFSEKGFSNTSTREIAETAGVAEGTIFKHFGSKQNLLFVTVLPIFSDILFREMMAFVKDKSGPAEVAPFQELIHKVLITYAKQSNVNQKIIKIFIGELLYQKRLQEELLKLIPSELIDRVAVLLNYYKDDKQIVDWPNGVIIRLILSLILSDLMLDFPEWNQDVNDEKEEDTHLERFIVKGLSLQR